MVQFPPSLPLQLTSSYSSALSRILEALASIASDFTNTMQVVAGSFIEMLFALCVTRSVRWFCFATFKCIDHAPIVIMLIRIAGADDFSRLFLSRVRGVIALADIQG